MHTSNAKNIGHTQDITKPSQQTPSPQSPSSGPFNSSDSVGSTGIEALKKDVLDTFGISTTKKPYL